MNAQRIKTILIRVLGERLTARIQGRRFARIIRRTAVPDPEVELLSRFVAKGDVTIDVGANGANWTFWLHRVVGPEGRVFAFEADPYYAMATQHAIRILRLKGAHLFPFGLSEKEELVPLRILDDSNQRVSGLGYVDREATRDQKEVTIVHLKPLDSLLAEFPEIQKTSLLKCDVEGYELFVFRGADQLLATARPTIILEIGNYEKQGYTASDVFDFFRKRSYSPFAIVPRGGLSPTDNLLNNSLAISVNRVLIPEEKVVLVRDLLQIKN